MSHEFDISPFTRFTNLLPEAMLIVSGNGTVLLANRATAEMLGLKSPKECAGRALSEFVAAPLETVENFIKAAARTGELLPSTLTFRHANGSSVQMGCEGAVLQPATDGGGPVLLMRCTAKETKSQRFTALSDKVDELAREVNRRIKAEIVLHELNQELEEHVADRTAKLRDANIALQQNIQHLKEAQGQLVESEKMAALGGLVAGIAHEINTPVGIGVTAASHLAQKITSFEQLVTSGAVKRADLSKHMCTCKETCQMILTNLQRAADLIRSFKLVAVDQSSQQKRSFDVKEYIGEILLSLRPQLNKTQHTVEVNCPDNLTINSYPGAFSQILTNFILNSLIHGFEEKPKGKIEIDITQENGALSLAYHDDGKGIPQEALPKIFEPFYTTKRGHGGSGLGLHVAYNLVTQTLGGRIRCESLPYKRTSFVLELPLSKE